MNATCSGDSRDPESDLIQVLYVDDDLDFAELTATFLERENERVDIETVRTASDGLERLAAEHFECIISDYDMPGRNGLEFLDAVREEYPDLPFILFTGKGSEEVASKAFSAGATDYLQKGKGTDQYTVLANRVLNYAEKYRGERATKRWSQAIQTTNEGIAIVDEDGRYVEINEAYAEFHGASPDEIIGEHWTLTVAADEAARLQEEVLPRLAEHGEWTGETVGRRADGSTYPKLVSLALLDEGGHVCTARDITHQKEHEQSMRQLKEEFETVFDTAQDALFLYDVVETDSQYEFELRRLNPAHEAISGLSSEDLRGATPREIVGDEQGAEVAANLRRCVEAKEPISYEEVLEMPSRTINWQTKLGPVIKDGVVTQIVGVARDITDQKERQQELERIRDFFSHAERLGDLGAWEFNDAGEAVWTEGTRQIHEVDDGFDPTVEAGIEFFHPADRDTIEQAVDEAIETGDPYDVQARLVTANGNERWVRTHGEPIDTTENRTIVRGYIQDITDQKERRQALTESNTVLRTIVNNLPMGVLVENTDRDVLMANNTLCEVLDIPFSSEELIGQDCVTAAEEIKGLFADPDGFVNRINERIAEREQVREELDLADGRTIERYYVPYTLPDGAANLWLYRDITDRKQRQRELERQNERLDEFTGVVSHDLSDPLRIAQGRIEMAQAECDSDHLDDAANALDRGFVLLEDLLTLARHGEAIGELEPVDLVDAIDGCWQTGVMAEAKLIVETDQVIRADRSRIKQLLENLFRNAVEHGGDDVTITVGELDDGNGFYVEDDGPGISEGERHEVFETGYSTSEQGTGFGLNIVKQVAEAHGWEIDVTEGAKGGARFEITGVEFAAE